MTKRTNNDLQIIHIKLKPTPDSPEEEVVPAPLVAPVVFKISLHNFFFIYTIDNDRRIL